MLIFSALHCLITEQSHTSHRETMDTGDGAQTFSTARLWSHPNNYSVSEGPKYMFCGCFSVHVCICVRERAGWFTVAHNEHFCLLKTSWWFKVCYFCGRIMKIMTVVKWQSYSVHCAVTAMRNSLTMQTPARFFFLQVNTNQDSLFLRVN